MSRWWILISVVVFIFLWSLIDFSSNYYEKEKLWLLDVSIYPVPFSLIERIVSELDPLLKNLTFETDYFKYYRLNLFAARCPFWGLENGLCGNKACMVDVLEDPLLSEAWKPSILGKIQGLTVEQPFLPKKTSKLPFEGALGTETSERCIYEESYNSDRDYCIPEDESEENIVYVSLVDNPEKYTGYSGESAHQVWRAIYRENCFEVPHNFVDPMIKNKSLFSNKLEEIMVHRNNWNSKDNEGKRRGAMAQEPVCLEKRLFYRIISGMHASISTHLCKEYLNKTTGLWEPNFQCFMERVGNYSDRIENIYFNYVLILRALAKLDKYLQNYTFCEGDNESNTMTKYKVNKLISKISFIPKLFDEKLMFDTSHNSFAIHLKDEFRMRFRNVSKLMDCVSCDKCRLWGKIQIAGFGTALKILFEFDDFKDQNEFSLRRTELVALINTFDRISSSIHFIQEFSTILSNIDNNFYKHNNSHALHFFSKIKKTILHKSSFNLKCIIKSFSVEYNNIKDVFIYIINSWVRIFKTIYIYIKRKNRVIFFK
ncbi:hypothetical protein T552_00424 [Pneumocystis carinii B80]|uniref:Endoplasmic oxidoreductin-1 n=1 Tax=Pneumocystis carinii (strain B80) TaxID=1408658 RepID=A0A0W4ZQR6_PNEC8|nr:hypothetical protein T552_00424 [Pneumocystis carinii B80]KTW30712.1 hypothetical protein T552_00424 [Pneumocystis carinii B80]